MFSSRTLTDPLGIDIDLRPDFLEDHWGDESRCEALHCYSDDGAFTGVECTVLVTHRHRSCVTPAGINVCGAFATDVAGDMKPGIDCSGCDRPVLQCWTLVAI